MKEWIIEWIKSYYTSTIEGTTHFNEKMYMSYAPLWAFGMFLATISVSLIIWWISKNILLRILHSMVDFSKSTWDDHLLKNKFFRALAHLVPLFIMDFFLSITFYQYPKLEIFTVKLVDILILLVVMVSINRFLTSVRGIIEEKERNKDKPIKSYFQVVKIINSGIFFVFILSLLIGRSPVVVLTSFGAISAILLLIFKDTILGFVSSIQLSVNDLIRIGDWVTIDKYGADGDVEEINVATVKVRNFDKTITTIPTYSLISESFKNWRGMQESDGRRIKRSVYLQIDSVRFADEEMLNRLKRIKVLEEFISERQEVIRQYNEKHGFIGENAINARRQTNLGLFRRYLEYYLRNKPEINKEMTLMVRQLAMSNTGVPLEIYCFTKTKEWGEYEIIQADVFDHIYSMVKQFDLVVFENPSGNDFRKLRLEETKDV